MLLEEKLFRMMFFSTFAHHKIKAGNDIFFFEKKGPLAQPVRAPDS